MRSLSCEQVQASARLPGTSFTEQGKTATIAPQRGEMVTFYRVDAPAVRDYFNATGKFPDLLVVREKEGKADKDGVLLELKGRDWNHALQQLEEGLSKMRGCVEGALGVKRWSAVVVLGGGSAPKKTDDARRRFEKKCEVTPHVNSGRTCDLRKLLP